jgi:RNA polymerase sigma factor (sigma-70 family)
VDRNTSGAPGATPQSQPPSTDEGELVAAVLRRNRKAAAGFVAAHIDAVYAYARHRLARCEDLVDDVVQDVFLAALNGLAAFQGQSSLRGWLIGIARHKVEDVYRRRLRASEAIDATARADEQQSADSPAIEERLDSRRTRERARHILARLPERYAIVLLWRYWEQQSVREIADAIGTTEKSVERTLARARARFKQAWIEEEREAP